jgi:uncharacterized membrane protein YraQ (UPF0718 family)
MKILRKIKSNIFAVLVAASYLALFVVKPSLAVTSLQNSVYFIKEMILIMPVIFVLTALLDLWVPKEKIVQLLGKEAKAKGIVLSVVLGSISAGPIYAAFPLCVMLHKKGATVRNLIIILSAWAVIKVPMLITEMKFLGLQFMALRWVLTLSAILIFSWIASLMVKDSDLPSVAEKDNLPQINAPACMGCSLCARSYPELFEMDGGKAVLKPLKAKSDKGKLQNAILACPVKAITWNPSSETEQ